MHLLSVKFRYFQFEKGVVDTKKLKIQLRHRCLNKNKLLFRLYHEVLANKKTGEFKKFLKGREETSC